MAPRTSSKKQSTKTFTGDEIRLIAMELNEKLQVVPPLDVEEDELDIIKQMKELKGEVYKEDQLSMRAFSFLQSIGVLPKGVEGPPMPKVEIRKVLRKQTAVRNIFGFKENTTPDYIDRYFLRENGAVIDEPVRLLMGRKQMDEATARSKVYDRIQWYKQQMRSKGRVWFFKCPKTKRIRVGVGKRPRNPIKEES